MEIIIALTSILAITVFVWLINRILSFKVCPICAGVSGTWLWILGGLYLGFLKAEDWQLIASMAMGGSIVGIAYQLEKKILNNRLLLIWKTLFIPAGFTAVYSILEKKLAIFLAALFFILLAVILFIFILPNTQKYKPNEERIEELKKKMKNCC